MAWIGVITNAGADILSAWPNGGTCSIDSAAGGTGTVTEAALLAQTDLVERKQTASIVAYKTVNGKQEIRIQFLAAEAEYKLQQIGIWGSLNGGESVMLALFQNTDGVQISGHDDFPDFAYVFRAVLSIANRGELSVTIDPSALVIYSTMQEAIAEAAAVKQNKLTGVPGQVVGFDASGNAVAQAAPDTGVTTFNGRTGAVTPQTGDYTAAQVGAAAANHTHTAAAVGARPSTWTPTAADVGAVPTTRKVNNKALSADISLTAADVGAVPTTRKVNNKALSADISLTAADVGAATSADVNAINARLNGTALAIGSSAIANASGSIALGSNANAVWQEKAIAIGVNATASAIRGIALGVEALASSTSDSIAIGLNARSLGPSAISIGPNTKSDTWGVAMGANATLGKEGAIAIGQNATATSRYSSALGPHSTAGANGAVALGLSAVTANINSIQLGNASNLSSITAKVSITVTSDERDKADIVEVEDGATEFLKKIKAVTYVYNQRELYRPVEPEEDEEGKPIIEEGVDYLTDEDHENLSKYGFCRYDKDAHKAGGKKGSRRRIGVLAQQVQAALESTFGSASYANLVNDNLFDFEDVPDGIESTLAMNYEGFIPFLIKGFQELEQRVAALEGTQSS